MHKTQLFLSDIHVKYIDNAALAAFSHIDIERNKMFTMKLFDGLVSPRRDLKVDRDLLIWARTEYKRDAEFAYNYMLQNGSAPNFGALR